MTRRLWLIDDTPGHHAVAQASADTVGEWEFTGFLSGGEAIEAVRGGLPMPEVILMDFFIGDSYGNEVTRALRGLETADHRPVIIGYSSMRAASERIVAAGGDLILAKRNVGGTNPGLLSYLRRWAAVADRPDRDQERRRRRTTGA